MRQIRERNDDASRPLEETIEKKKEEEEEGKREKQQQAEKSSLERDERFLLLAQTLASTLGAWRGGVCTTN